MHDPSKELRCRVSVIVTNYNYRHFLGPCLDSLRVQTDPADEIIVVDDGSTDGSRGFLERQKDIHLVLQENAGQTAAFNAGFAASTGEALLFLDADDTLRPEALAVIRRMRTNGFSALSFNLDKIDALGRTIGRYEMDLPDSDLLPRMMNGLTFPFMPTSGNVFSRRAIGWAFPLPTERWRISADALLIRAAVLSGPIRHIRQVLGDYRVHGNNNYFRISATQNWKAHRGLRHVAEAGLDLIAMCDLAGRGLTRGQRAKLLIGSLHVRLKSEALAADSSGLDDFLRRMIQHSPAKRDRRLNLALRLAAVGIGRSARLRHWATDPRERPRWLQAVLDWLFGHELRHLIYEVTPPRSPFDGALVQEDTENLDLVELLTAPEWVRDHGSGGFDLRADRGRFTLRRAPSQPTDIAISVAPPDDRALSVAVLCNGEPQIVTTVEGNCDLTFMLPENRSAAWHPHRIDLVVSDAQKFGGVLQRLMRRSVRLRVINIASLRTVVGAEDAVLPVLAERPFSELGDVLRSRGGRPLVGEKLIGLGERLSLAPPALAAPFCLVLRFAGDQNPGDISIHCAGKVLFFGAVEPGSRIVVEIPKGLKSAFAPFEIIFGFKPQEFLDGTTLHIAALGWLPEASHGRYGKPLLSPGERSGAGGARGLEPFLETGWQLIDGGDALMTGPTAELHLSQGAVGSERQLQLDLEPLDPHKEEAAPVLVVSVNGERAQTVRLATRSLVDVPLSGIFSGPRHKVEIGLHAAGLTGEGNAVADHGGIVLHGIGLAPQSAPVFLTASAPEIGHEPPLVRLAGRLEQALSQANSDSELEDLRAEIIKEIGATEALALPSVLTPDDLGRFLALGQRLGPLAARSRPDSTHWDGRPETWIMFVALAMLTGPAFEQLAGISLSTMPEMPSEIGNAVASYLVGDPAPGRKKTALRAYQAELASRLAEARIHIANDPIQGTLWQMASAMIDAVRARQLLFSDIDLKPHTVAFAEALEARLLRTGHCLSLPAGQGKMRSGKIRVGVLAHHCREAPETWIARALLRAFPADAAEVTLFLTEESAPAAAGFEDVSLVGLAGLSVAETVAAIRSEGLDVLILGASFHGYCFMAEIAAHRLATRQIAMSAIFPATTGFASVDEFLLGYMVTPKAAYGDTSERAVRAPGTAQIFDFGPAEPPAPELRDVTRRRLGAGPQTIVLTSGAMQDKIGPELLELWLSILLAQPEAMLVLYPFAKSWQQSYDERQFASRLAASCVRNGIARDRVRCLPAIPSAEVRQVLAASDIYLDSFPYSGATTTVEALRSGLPVVARRGRTQRGQQAAGWLTEFGLDELIAGSDQEYVKIASELAGAAAWRTEIAARVRGAQDEAFAQEEFVGWMTQHVLGDLPKETDGYRYLFHHMPKTGGTSVKSVLSQWFDIVEDYREPWAYSAPPPVNLDALGPGGMLAGHFAADRIPLSERYPETLDPERWRRICFIRDPLERVISIHAYEKALRFEYDQTYRPLSLDDYLRRNHGIFLSHFECSAETWRDALDRYWFIGTLERLPECFDYLAAALRKPPPNVLPHDNATPRKETPSPEAAAVFRDNNAVEFEIYDEVARRLDRLLG